MECGDCTLCCEIFPVRWLDKPANSPCTFCDKGCLIHSEKPQECKDFNCAYAQSGSANIKYRPDKCGIVFEKISDRIFYGTLDPKKQIPDEGRNQIYAFNRQGFSVVLFSFHEKKPAFVVNQDHNVDEIRKEFYGHLKKLKSRYGSFRN